MSSIFGSSLDQEGSSQGLASSGPPPGRMRKLRPGSAAHVVSTITLSGERKDMDDVVNPRLRVLSSLEMSLRGSHRQASGSPLMEE